MRPMMSADEPGAEDCIQRTGFVGHASDRAMSGWMSAHTVKTAYRIRITRIIDCSGKRGLSSCQRGRNRLHIQESAATLCMRREGLAG
jgi:hypothetical protein